MKSSPTREALLEAACMLFYQNGIRGTSVDAILERAGAARQSLYLHFSSKDGLVAEFLKARDQSWRHRLQQYIAQGSSEPYGQILVMFDFLAEWFREPDFCGCAFINTSIEYADPGHPFHQLGARHKELVQQEILDLCRQAGLVQPEQLAAQLALLMEGAIVTEQVSRSGTAAMQAKEIAKVLLNHTSH